MQNFQTNRGGKKRNFDQSRRQQRWGDRKLKTNGRNGRVLGTRKHSTSFHCHYSNIKVFSKVLRHRNDQHFWFPRYAPPNEMDIKHATGMDQAEGLAPFLLPKTRAISQMHLPSYFSPPLLSLKFFFHFVSFKCTIHVL